MYGFTNTKGQPESLTQKVEGRMAKISKKQGKSKCRINKVEPTAEKITGRAGLSLFVRYLENVQIIASLLMPCFGRLRKNRKGVPVYEIFKQLFCFFMDGTSSHLAYFDQVKNDAGYSATIETQAKHMVSSHSIKRFFRAFRLPLVFLFRRIHLRIFAWRLRVIQPKAVVMYLDAMVMDNNEAEKREHVRPTYKKCKGFNALQLTWEGYLADTSLRPGHIHSNSGRNAERMIRRMVKTIRTNYRTDVPIIFRMDSGFMDQKLYKVFEELEVGYIGSGKLYSDITNLMATIPSSKWQRYFGPGDVEDNRIWEYVEFGDRRDSWDTFRRAIFTRPMSENGQIILPFVRPCTVLYTNLGMGYAVDGQLKAAELDWLLQADGVIDCFHDQGRGELTFRSFKDFGSEELPFQGFKQNAAFYHCMVLGYNLYQAFKEDVCPEVVSASSYPTTLRRKVIDIGGKIVSTSHQIILKVSRAVFDALDFTELWRRCCSPPRIEA
jgi:hypothetical protein